MLYLFIRTFFECFSRHLRTVPCLGHISFKLLTLLIGSFKKTLLIDFSLKKKMNFINLFYKQNKIKINKY